MRVILSLLGVATAAVLLFVSAAMNWRFGFSLGRTELDGQIYGAASAAADGMKALLPFFVMWALRQKNYGQVLSGTLLWLVCAAYSLTSSLGFAALNRAEVTGERTAQAYVYQDLRTELKREQEKLGWVPQHRSIGEVNADLTAVLATPIYKKRKHLGTLADASNNCASTNWLTRRGCDKVLNLKKELAAAKQAEKLETRIGELKADIAKLSASAASSAASGKSDPQADLLSKLTGLKTSEIQIGLVILVSMLVELGSGLGLFVAFSHMTVSNRPPIPAAETSTRALTMAKPPRRRLFSRSDVERYYASNIIKVEGESLTSTEVYKDYVLWCERKGKTPLAHSIFGRQLSELGVTKTRIADRTRYVNVQLKARDAESGASEEMGEELEAVRDTTNPDHQKRHYAIG